MQFIVSFMNDLYIMTPELLLSDKLAVAMVSFTTDDVLHKRTPTFVKRQSMHGSPKDADTNEIQTMYKAVLLCTLQIIDFHNFRFISNILPRCK